MESAILTMDAAGVTNDMKNFNWILFLTVAICSLNAAPHQKMLVRSSKLLCCRIVIKSIRGPNCPKEQFQVILAELYVWRYCNGACGASTKLWNMCLVLWMATINPMKAIFHCVVCIGFLDASFRPLMYSCALFRNCSQVALFVTRRAVL